MKQYDVFVFVGFCVEAETIEEAISKGFDNLTTCKMEDLNWEVDGKDIDTYDLFIKEILKND